MSSIVNLYWIFCFSGLGCGGRRDLWQKIHTCDKNPSSDSPPNAFLSSASLYGNSLNGLQKMPRYS